jgi:hypothetical protein
MEPPRVILTCFAGRKRYLEILLKYTEYLHKHGHIHEVHLWDFTRATEDTEWLKTSLTITSSPYISVKNVRNKHSWLEYYRHYTQSAYPAHVIIKCDDDVVFIDVKTFPEFIQRTVEEDTFLLRFPSIINNGVCAHYQQKWGLIPNTLDTFPYDTCCGKLWASGALCQKLHEYFLDNHETWLETTRALPNKTCKHPLGNRISINFFAVCSKNLNLYQIVGSDDEKDLSITLSRRLKKEHAVDTNFTVSHFAFGSQREKMDEPMLLEKYTALATNLENTE